MTFPPIVFTPSNLAPATDPYFSSVVLLVDFNGDMTDDSNSGHTLTPSGDATTNTTNPPSFQAASAAFDGTGDYVTIADSANWDFGTGDFTVEGWLRSGHTITDAILAQFGTNDKGWAFFDDGNALIEFYWSTDGTTNTSMNYNHGDQLNVWKHVAASRVSNTLYLCYGEVIRATADVTGTTFRNSGRPLVFGANNNGSSANFGGRLAEWRITKGVGRYSGAVNDAISPSAPFPRA